MLSGDNSILQKATDAKTNSENEQIRERIQLAYHSALINGQGKITEDLLETELTNEFGERDTAYTLADNETQWNIAIIGTDVSESIPKPSNLDGETQTYGIQEDGSFITAPGEQPTDGKAYAEGEYRIFEDTYGWFTDAGGLLYIIEIDDTRYSYYPDGTLEHVESGR